MIRLHYRVKFRAFGITFTTIEDTVDVTSLIRGLIVKAVPAIALGADFITTQTLPEPVKLYDDRGVFIELV